MIFLEYFYVCSDQLVVKMMQFLLLFSRQGKLRLQKWYSAHQVRNIPQQFFYAFHTVLNHSNIYWAPWLCLPRVEEPPESSMSRSRLRPSWVGSGSRH